MRRGSLEVGSAVELREIYRPNGAWDFDGPAIRAGAVGRVEASGDGFWTIVHFAGYGSVRIPRSLLKTTTRDVPRVGVDGPPPGLPPA